MIDRDRIHKERVDTIVRRLNNEDETDGLFVSEFIDDTIGDPKIFLGNYDLNRILAHLPYHELVYVAICPRCIAKKDFDQFKTLVERKAIVPTLIAPYGSYDSEIVDLIYPRDHLNRYEYLAYRFLRIVSHTDKRICGHCVGVREKNIKNFIKKNASLIPYKRTTTRTVQNLHPFIFPDFELLDALEEAVRNNDEFQIELISEMSEVIHSIRSFQAFNSPMDLRDSYIDSLPTGVTSELDLAVRISNQVSAEVADGLGLKIPMDMPLESYIEIVENYRPQISAVVTKVTSGHSSERSAEVAAIQRQLMGINAEIDRIQKSRRYMLLEASVDFYGKNSPLLNAALVAGALGLAGGLSGCVGSPALSGTVVGGLGAVASGVGSLAKKKQWVKGGAATDRFLEKMQSDLQPFINQLVALYVGASEPAVAVMSLRQKLAGPSVVAGAQPKATTRAVSNRGK